MASLWLHTFDPRRTRNGFRWQDQGCAPWSCYHIGISLMRYAAKDFRMAVGLRVLPLLSFAALAHAADHGVLPPPVGDGGRPTGSAWAAAAKMPDLFSGMWMTFSGFVEGDEGLNVPYTAKARQYVADYKPKRDI